MPARPLRRWRRLSGLRNWSAITSGRSSWPGVTAYFRFFSSDLPRGWRAQCFTAKRTEFLAWPVRPVKMHKVYHFALAAAFFLLISVELRADEVWYQVGASQIDITPTFPIRLGGYAARTMEA